MTKETSLFDDLANMLAIVLIVIGCFALLYAGYLGSWGLGVAALIVIMVGTIRKW